MRRSIVFSVFRESIGCLFRESTPRALRSLQSYMCIENPPPSSFAIFTLYSFDCSPVARSDQVFAIVVNAPDGSRSQFAVDHNRWRRIGDSNKRHVFSQLYRILYTTKYSLSQRSSSVSIHSHRNNSYEPVLLAPVPFFFKRQHHKCRSWESQTARVILLFECASGQSRRDRRGNVTTSPSRTLKKQ